MHSVWRSPSWYVQGPGALGQLSEYVPMLGRNPVIMASATRLEALGPRVLSALTGLEPTLLEFSGECCDEEIDRLLHAVKESGGDMVIAAGGGKTLDTAKAVGDRLNVDTIAIPTIAATDAPTAAAAIIYTPEGVFERVEIYPHSPSVVLVDTDVIRDAPARFLVSGMGDAVATRFEAEACLRSGTSTVAGGAPTRAAVAIARQCYDILSEHGAQAIDDLQASETTMAIEEVVEANTLLSGVGFESGGLAAAHSIHNGLTAIEATHDFYHGEKVAFSTICQLLLQDDRQLADEVASFNRTVGLPVSLADLGLDDHTDDDLRTIASKACESQESIHNMPFDVTTEAVVECIANADALGRSLT